MKKSRPKAQAVAFRVMAMKFPITWAIVTPPQPVVEGLKRKGGEDYRQFALECANRRDRTVKYLREIGLWRSLTAGEQAVMETTPLSITRQQQIDASWAVEAAQVLMWSLRMIDALPPYGTLADPELLKRVPSEELDAFARSAMLRSDEEIEHACKLAEFWHWRSRTRQIIERGDPFPASPQMTARAPSNFDDVIRMSAKQGEAAGDLPPCVAEDFNVNGKAYRDLSPDEWSRTRSMTLERHRALNWLCGYSKGNDWDKTPTDT